MGPLREFEIRYEEITLNSKIITAKNRSEAVAKFKLGYSPNLKNKDTLINVLSVAVKKICFIKKGDDNVEEEGESGRP